MIERAINSAASVKRQIGLALIKTKVPRYRYFLHYTPDVSGGVATFLEIFAKAFPEFTHLIVCSRGIDNRASMLLCAQTNVIAIGHIERKAIISFCRDKPPRAVLNHLFWDLQPLTEEDMFTKRISILSLWHSQDVKWTREFETAGKPVVFSQYYREIYPNMPQAIIPAVLPLAVDETKFAPSEPARTETFVVGNITNGAAWKYSEDFVDLCREIKRSIPVTRFSLLGARRLFAQTKDLDYIHLLPPFSIATSEYLGSINILLHKTRSDICETWGFTITEAMCAGVPVVVEARGGLKDQVIHGQTGFLCNSNEDFIRSCRLLYEDRGMWQTMSVNGRARARAEFSLPSFRHRAEKLLD